MYCQASGLCASLGWGAMGQWGDRLIFVSLPAVSGPQFLTAMQPWTGEVLLRLQNTTDLRPPKHNRLETRL